MLNDVKYIGLDVHQATISVAVLDSARKLMMEAILETKAETILQFIRGLRGSLHVTFEEGTCAAWLHDLLKPHVAEVLVCDPRKNVLLRAGNKNDRIDARKLADLLRTGLLSPVYHGDNGIRTLKELARSYLALNQDVTRVMNRLKAVYRSWAIPCAGQRVYAPRYRSEWVSKISEVGVYADYENGFEEIRDLQRNLGQFLGLEKLPDDFRVWTPDCGSNLDIEDICRDVKPALLVIDSLRAYNPTFEKTEFAGQEMSSLRSAAYKYGVAVLVIHHVRKPGHEGVPPLDDDGTAVMLWLNQAAGHRSIINQSDSRIAADLSKRVPESAMILRWHRRMRGEGGPLFVERITNDQGEPVGYAPLVGPKLLGNDEQEAALARLPDTFRFKEATTIYGRADDPTRKWLLKCVAAGLVKQVARGAYQRTWSAVVQ